MKKTYIIPELTVQLIHSEGLIALSLQSGPATSDDALVKGSGDWDIWGSEAADTEE